MSATVEFDWLAVDCLATARKRSHERAGNHRPAYALDSLAAERIGAAGEAAFAMQYGLPAPDADRVAGDDGHDYRVRWDGAARTVEIKASEYDTPSLMLSTEYDHAVDRYVVASVSWPTEVEFVGWIDSDDVSTVGQRAPSQFGGEMWVVDGADLRAMPDAAEVCHAE
jgi:hypothetical protein